MADEVRPKPGSVFVKIGPVPRFRVLSDIDRRAERESQFLLDATLKQIKRVVREAPEDPGDDVLAAAASLVAGDPRAPVALERSLRAFNESRLEKSAGVFDARDPELTLEEAIGLQQIAHELRKEHGAPIRPGGLIDGDMVPPSPAGDRRMDALEAINRILGMIPFRSGRIVPDRNGALRLTEEVEPLPDAFPISLAASVFLDEDIRSADVRSVLQGELEQTVRAIRHPGPEPVFTIFEGTATWLAADLLGLAALEVELSEPSNEQVERSQAPAEPPHDLRSDLKAVKFQASRFAYRVPPVLEPVAEVARDLSMRVFLDAYAGKPGTEEIVARRRADILNTNRDRVWMAIYKASRMAGASAEEATGRATRSPEFRRANSTWRAAQRPAVRVEEEGTALREKLRLAKAQVLNIHRELGLDLADFVVDDAAQLWFHARRGPDAFTEEELVDRVDQETIDQRRDTAGLPTNVSAPRFTNLRTDDGSPRLFLRPPQPRAGEDSDAPETVPTPLVGPVLIVDARIPLRDNAFVDTSGDEPVQG